MCFNVAHPKEQGGLINPRTFAQDVTLRDVIKVQISNLWSRLWKTEEETKTTDSADFLTQLQGLMSSQFFRFLLIQSHPVQLRGTVRQGDSSQKRTASQSCEELSSTAGNKRLCMQQHVLTSTAKRTIFCWYLTQERDVVHKCDSHQLTGTQLCKKNMSGTRL